MVSAVNCGWVIDIGEGMCYGERCELCKTVKSQICTSETNNAIYVSLKLWPVNILEVKQKTS